MRVLGLGDNVVDVYRNLNRVYLGGNALNMCINAKKLGFDSSYIGHVASDAYGKYLKMVTDYYDVDISNCHFVPYSTTKQCIVDMFDGERTFIKNNIKNNYAGDLILSSEIVNAINKFDVVFTSVNAKITDELPKLADFEGTIYFDFGEKDKYHTNEYISKVIPYVHIVQFSLSGKQREEILEFLEKNHFEIPVIITRGSKNPFFYYNGQLYEGYIKEVEAIDTMGAGDAFASAFVTKFIQTQKQKIECLDDLAIKQILSYASEYSSTICLVDGAFGNPLPLNDIKAVIFDMDGVLVDSEDYWLSVANKMIEDKGFTLNNKDAVNFYGCSFEEEYQIVNQYLNIDFDQFIDLRKRITEEFPLDYKDIFFDGVMDTIRMLKKYGVELAIASSSHEHEIKKMLRETQTEKYFQTILAGDKVNHAKPSPEIYEKICQSLGYNKEHILVIEDSSIGVSAAKAAGLFTISIHNESSKEFADISFSNHNRLYAYLNIILERKTLLCPSLMCMDFAHLGNEIDELNKTECDIFHCDVMDGVYVSNMALGYSDILTIRKKTNKLMDVHLMVEQPENFIDYYLESGVDIVYIHPETVKNVGGLLNEIKQKGGYAGIAINPEINISMIEDMLKIVDFVLVMTVYPGFSGQKFVEDTIRKVKRLIELKDQYDFILTLDGAMSSERINFFQNIGVNSFVLGTSSLFNKEESYEQIISQLKKG